MTGPWDGFGSPADGSVSHLADLFADHTSCGLPRLQVSWTSVTTRTTCALCAAELRAALTPGSGDKP